MNVLWSRVWVMTSSPSGSILACPRFLVVKKKAFFAVTRSEMGALPLYMFFAYLGWQQGKRRFLTHELHS